MDLRETANFLLIVKATYRKWFDGSKEEFAKTVECWHDILGDEPYEMAKNAFDEFSRDSVYPPTPADIYKPYKEYLEGKKEKNKRLREIYYRTISYFPCYKDTPEMQNEWMRITQNDIGKAERFERVLISYVHECETMGVEPLTFEEYMKGVKQIE